VVPAESGSAFLERRRDAERAYLGRIAGEFTGHRLYRVPLAEQDIVGTESLRRLRHTVEAFDG